MFPYAEFAKLLGLEGIYCDQQSDVGSAWDQALALQRPVVLEFKVDPEVPPVPPHIKTEQAKKAAKAVAKGDPEGTGVVMTGMRQKLAEFYEKLPGRG